MGFNNDDYIDSKFLERFHSNVLVTDGCWEWQGNRRPNGYGRIQSCTNGAKTDWSTHRVAWALHNGRFPQPNEFVCHRCDNPPCCNPAHLFLGDAKENALDKVSKGRQRRGRLHGNAKLTDADVLAIRSSASTGEPQRRIALRYGITQGNVSHIVTGRCWGWL